MLEIEERHRLASAELAVRVRQIKAQCSSLNLGFREAKSRVESMTGSMSWKVTGPLRIVWDASTAFLNKVKNSAEGSSNATANESYNQNPRAHFLADLIRSSGFFDHAAYEGNAEAQMQGMDSALHYVLVGEKKDSSPPRDSTLCITRNVIRTLPPRLKTGFGHYLEMGQMEGRRATPIADSLTYPDNLKTALPTVLLLIHVASRTGAPILGWNIARSLRNQVNVVAVLMRGGQLEDAFTEVGPVVKCASEQEFDLSDPTEGARLARKLAETYQPLYAIANSVETRTLAVGLGDQGVPVVALVHEFSGYTKPSGTLQPLYERASEIVFSADIVRRSSEVDYPILSLRRSWVLPQGPSEVPRTEKSESKSYDTVKRKTIDALRPAGAEDDLVVIGMGFVDWRKGVDLFIAAATAIIAPHPETAVRFIWIGQGYQSTNTIDVSSYLSEQIARSGLGDRFALLDAVEDVESIYNEADVLFLSSRLDPLPNVSIDAALRGIPVVCFAEASGMAEILASVEETRELVVPHLDAGAAGALIHSLALDAEKLGRLSKAIREVAQERFNMSAYVTTLDELGRKASSAEKQMDAEVETILETGGFDLPLYLGTSADSIELSAAVKNYVSLAGKIDYERLPEPGVYTRRPLAGFHPRAYALQKPDYKNQAGRDPLAHYLKAGRPKGPWEHPVLRIEGKSPSGGSSTSAAFNVVLHGHFHYTDQIGEFLRAVSANAQPCELILTTNTSAKRDEIEGALGQAGMKAEVRIVPNRGRDVGPFLNLLAELVDRCDLLGHVHGKRSTHVDREFSERWRIFLWQHLIGDEMPMIDIIKQAFIEDPRLGLVFPEDPFLLGWEQNLVLAQELAARLGLKAPLSTSINFPMGTMFWARPRALGSLIKLRVAEEEYPHEPVPVDGTILHALERLLPIIAEDAGYHYATTYFPRYVR